MEWRAYRKSLTLFPTVPFPTPYGLLFPEIGVCNPHPKLQSLKIISGTGKATNFKFGQNNKRVHPNKSPLKILEKRERGRIQVSRYPLLSQEWVTLRKFCTHIYSLSWNKSPLKISGKVAVGVVWVSRKFSGHS